MTHLSSFNTLSDRDLIEQVKQLASAERQSTAALVASLAEMDKRRLYLGEGCSSLFTYCTRVLHLSEHAAYGRIEAARAVRRFRVVLERLERGELTLTNLCLLRSHLTDENHLELLDAARHASKRDVERLVAAIAPQPDAPVVIRKLPATVATLTPSAPGPTIAVPSPRSECDGPLLAGCPQELNTGSHSTVVDAPVTASAGPTSTGPISSRPPVPVLRPLAPERFKVQFTIGRETHDKLRRAQDLLRHAVPDGDPAAILDRALTVLLEQLERAKAGAARRPRPARAPQNGSRHIPATVRRAVWKRDQGRCAFEGNEGRCGETAFLEFHHLIPFTRGGPATPENIQLRCRAHNQYHAVEEFGARALLSRERAPVYRSNRAPERRTACAKGARCFAGKRLQLPG